MIRVSDKVICTSNFKIELNLFKICSRIHTYPNVPSFISLLLEITCIIFYTQSSFISVFPGADQDNSLPCVGASPKWQFMNTIICFCSCRDDESFCVTTLSVLPKNLAARICGVSAPEKTSYVSCASKKRNKRWSFPHWWLISENTQSRPPKTVWYPASFPRGWPGVKGYSLAVNILKDRRGIKRDTRLLMLGCQWSCRVFVSPFLESALFFVTCIFWCRYSR